MKEEGPEQVMSEVHLGCPPGFSGPYITHFTFPLYPTDLLDERYNGGSREVSSRQILNLDDEGDLILMRRNADSLESNHAQYSDHIQAGDNSIQIRSTDKDGDLVLVRRTNDDRKCLYHGLTIQHNITSSLPRVGLQVWKAALILADFILHKISTSSEFNGISALELGSGTGLVGMILAPVAQTIFLTDIGIEVLDNCAANIHLNSSMLKFHETAVRVRQLNWKEVWPPPIVGPSDFRPPQRPRYSWSSSEIKEAEGATVLLAADVIYSDELTDSFFGILEALMSQGSQKVLYLALEKRYNFSLDELDVVANGYAHFRSFLKDEEGLENTLRPYFVGEQIDLTQIPQYIREYERGQDLEIWKIKYILKKIIVS